MLRIRSLVAGVLAACLSLLLVVPVANAVAPIDFPPSAPDESVTDAAEVGLMDVRQIAFADASGSAGGDG